MMRLLFRFPPSPKSKLSQGRSRKPVQDKPCYLQEKSSPSGDPRFENHLQSSKSGNTDSEHASETGSELAGCTGEGGRCGGGGGAVGLGGR